MKADKIVKALGNIDEQMIMEASMMNQVKKTPTKKIMTVAACAVLALGVSFGLNQINNTTPTPDNSLNSTPGATTQTPGATSPMGIRKMLNFNNLRYVFLDNGATFTLTDGLGEELGVLAGELNENQNTTTFADGGKLYTINGYHPDFRIAVVLDGNTYLAQSVAHSDNSGFNLSDYFAKAELSANTSTIDIFNHFGNENLGMVDSENISAFFQAISHATPIQRDENLFEKIAHAQTNGGSYLMKAQLKDNTTFQFYLLPALQLVMVGDNTYQLSDTTFEELLDIQS